MNEQGPTDPVAYPYGPRGFASMDPAKQRAIARLGGQRVHQLGRAHTWTAAEAREAGRKGGLAKRQPQTATQE